MKSVAILLAGAVALTAQTASPARKKAAFRPSAAAASAAPSYRDLKYPPLRQVEIPNVATFTLSNGLRLYLLENHELPTVNGFALVRTGNLFDPPDKVGLAGITGTVMRSGGTAKASGDELDVTLENVAASVESSIGETSGRVSFGALKENTDEVLAVFHDVLTAPEFRPDKIDLAKTQTRGQISRRNDNAHGIASREFSDILYGRDNPYGWRIEYEHLDRIQRPDLVAFYRRYFFPANVMLAVYGDFNTDEMKAKLEKLFADWTAQQSAVPPFPKVSAKPAPGIYLAKKEDVNQTFFEIGHMGGMLNDQDYPALEVMADILGGGFKSRLFNRVRTRLGYAYSIGADWGANYGHPGLFAVQGSTKSASTAETLQVIEEEIGRLRDSEVTDEELRTSKESVVNSFVFNFDTRTKTLSRMMNYEYYGYPKDFLFQYQKGIEKVTKADVLRVAREHLRPRDMTIVAVGNPKDFGKPLTDLSRPINEIDLKIPEPKSETKTDAASLAKGQRLLARAQQAVGGADKLAGIKDILQTAEVQLDASAGGMKAKQLNRWMAPGMIRQEIELPFGKIISYSDGASGWIAAPNGQQALTGQQLKQAQGDLFRMFIRLLLSDRDPNRTVNAVSDSVMEVSDKEGNSTRVTLDAAGLPAKQNYRGPQGEIEEQWSDFQDAGGIKLPRKMTVTQGTRKYADVTVLDIQLNTGVTAEDMKKRP